MSLSPRDLLPASGEAPPDRQRWFVRYGAGVLVDLVVLSLFAEYSANVHIDNFTTTLLAAVLLQVLLKLAIHAEQAVARFFAGRPGRFNRFLRFFAAWLVLLASKFAILEAIAFAFGDKVRFAGPMHGLVWLIVVIFVMLAAEELVVRIFRRLK